MMDKKANNRLAELREARGYSMARLAELAETDASTISKLEKGKTKLSADWLKRLASALECDPAAILGDPADAPAKTAQAPLAIQKSRPIPILGTAAGSHIAGAIQFTEGQAINYVERPPMLAQAADIYGLYVEGDSMWPMFKRGSLVLVSPYKPPRHGDAVIIQEQDGDGADIKATLGVLENGSGEVVRIRKLNPDAIVEIKLKYVKAVHRVLDFDDILGG